jgi:gas vesicle structural protein
MAIQPNGAGGAVERRQESTLGDVVSTVLDKGVVVDVFARVSLVGIELLRVDARVVIASVDTYLRFADAVDRLDMGTEEPQDLPEAVKEVTEAGSKGKSSGALEAGVDKLEELLKSRSDHDDERPRRERKESGR